jgi:hypothetical protein
MDGQIEAAKSAKGMAGVAEIRVPGERGLRRRDAIRAEGRVPLGGLAWSGLSQACEATNVPLPPVRT